MKKLIPVLLTILCSCSSNNLNNHKVPDGAVPTIMMVHDLDDAIIEKDTGGFFKIHAIRYGIETIYTDRGNKIVIRDIPELPDGNITWRLTFQEYRLKNGNTYVNEYLLEH